MVKMNSTLVLLDCNDARAPDFGVKSYSVVLNFKMTLRFEGCGFVVFHFLSLQNGRSLKMYYLWTKEKNSTA